MEADETQVIDGFAQVEGKVAPFYRCNGTRFAAEVPVTVHDFRKPAALSQNVLRQVELVQKKFAEHLAARLSSFLRMECSTALAKFETPSYRDFIEKVESPSQIALLQIEPLLGVGILSLSLPVCHSIVDRMLGGRGVAATEDRTLSEIEIALLEDATQVIIDEWCQQWRSATVLRPHCIGHDTSARFLKTSFPDAIMLVVELEVQLGSSKGRLQFGVPYSMVETMVKEAQGREANQGAKAPVKRPQWRASYDGFSVPVIAEWKVRDMRVQELISLSPGDILPMDPDLIARTHVQLATAGEFIGLVGIQNGRVAVQLTKHLVLEHS